MAVGTVGCLRSRGSITARCLYELDGMDGIAARAVYMADAAVLGIVMFLLVCMAVLTERGIWHGERGYCER